VRRLSFGPPGPLSILAVGAHADDIEIGAGGTILRLLDDHPGSRIEWFVGSATAERAAEARASAAAFSRAASGHDIAIADLPDARFPSVAPDVKDLLETYKARPFDLVIAPHRGDEHQDHRLLAEVVWQTFRDHLVIEYEILKYDGDLGRPNVFVELDEATCARKVELILDAFPSQAGRRWWGAETFRAILQVRGVEAAARYAEAFHCRKLVF
jgi:LmbE family N-acetylglucosaminyl deacetylase